MPRHDQQNLSDLSLEDLAKFVRKSISSSKGNARKAILLGRKSSVDLFRAGAALVAVKQQVAGSYVDWLDENKIARTTAHEAVKLYENAKTEAAIEKLTITEAKVLFGVVKEKPAKERKPRVNKPTADPVANDSEPNCDPEPKLDSEPDAVDSKPAKPVSDPPAKEPETVSKVLAMIVQRLESLASEDRNDADAMQVEKLIDRAMVVLVSVKVNHGVRINAAA